MANLTVKTVNDEQKFVYEKTIDSAGLHQVNFDTKNSFLDKDINVQITTPSASAPVLNATDISTELSMGTAVNGVYEPTVNITGNINVTTAGWITSGNKSVSDTAVKIGTVNQSLLRNGNTAIASGSEIVPSAEDQTINITEGYNSARAVVVKAASEMNGATISSGNATITELGFTFDSSNSAFNISATEEIPGPSVETPGYISTTKGERNSGLATVEASVAKIGIAANLSGTGTAKPVISKNVATNVDSGSATTSKPSAGFYVAVSSPANTSSVTATASVTSAGYGTTTSGQYTTVDSTALTVGADASDVTYVPITAVTFGNTASSGHTYTDISSTAPILISEDYLYINKGYTNDVKISLAKLVPDDATITASTGAGYMLDGQSAYDSTGKLVVGSIPTYEGAYSVG